MLYLHQSVWSVFATHLLYCGCGMHRSGSRQWEPSAFHTWIGWCLQSVYGTPLSCAEVCITHPTHCVPQKCAADFWAVMQCPQLLYHVAFEVEAEDTLHLLACHQHKTVPLEKTSGNIYCTNGEIWGKGKQIKQNRKLRCNWHTLYYFRCTMWWLNICIWQSFCEFSEIPHFVDWDSCSNWPNSGACIHWWSWVSRNFKSLYPWTFRIF